MKYHIYRKSNYTGRIEVLRTKCSDHWCSKEYLIQNPGGVWKFSESGAKKIIERNILNGWHFNYWMEPAEE